MPERGETGSDIVSDSAAGKADGADVGIMQVQSVGAEARHVQIGGADDAESHSFSSSHARIVSIKGAAYF